MLIKMVTYIQFLMIFKSSWWFVFCSNFDNFQIFHLLNTAIECSGECRKTLWLLYEQFKTFFLFLKATTERSIVIWDHRAKGKNQSNVHVIKPLEHSPQCMCLLPADDEHTDALLIGDDAGWFIGIKFTIFFVVHSTCVIIL